MKTLEQKRAEQAMQAVAAVADGKNKKESSDVRARLESLPALITTNGLLPAVLSLDHAASGDGSSAEAAKQVRNMLGKWLEGSDSPVVWQQEKGERQKGEAKRHEFAMRLAGTSPATYLLATVEATSYAIWLKHWAQALLEKRSEAGRG